MTLVLGAAFALSGCAKAPVAAAPDSTWIPASTASFATIDRDTHFARVHAEGMDLLVHEEPYDDGSMIWILNVPDTPRLNTPVDLGQGARAAARGWVVERPRNGPSHAAELDGRIVIHSKDAEAIRATVDVSASRGPSGAGAEFDSRVRLTKKLEWIRTGVTTPEYTELPTRGGVAGQARAEP